jgi:hypothetical protein
MKFFGSVLLFLKLFDEVFGDCKKLSPLACAFVDIKKSLEEKNRQISIQNFGENRNILESVLAGDSQLIIRHQKLEKFRSIKKRPKNQAKNQRKRYQIVESGILLFENLTSLGEFNYNTNFTNEGPKEWQFFVHIDKAKASGIKAAIRETKVFKKHATYNIEDRSEIINFQYFLIEEKRNFVLYTFVWYTQETCGRQQLVEVNRLDKNKKKWKNQKFKIDKFDNFFGCKLMFTFNPWPPEIGHNNKNWSLIEGFQYDLLVEISKVLNFTTDFVDDVYKHPLNTPNASRRFTPVSLHLEPAMMCQFNDVLKTPK